MKEIDESAQVSNSETYKQKIGRMIVSNYVEISVFAAWVMILAVLSIIDCASCQSPISTTSRMAGK